MHEISNNVLCGTSKASDQSAHMRSLIRTFASRLTILWLLSYWLNTIWSFKAFKGGCRGSSVSSLVKMSNCWKSHALARGCSSDILTEITVFDGALQRLLHKSIVTTSHRAVERRGLWFSGYRSLVWPCTNSAFARLVRGYKWLVHIIAFVFMHQSFVTPPPPAQRNVEDFDFVSAVPHSNHHTVGAASWQNHDSSPRSLFLYCTSMFV